jgi:4-amino-4-deoxy-L-arabinose transferase-like glycosyltransferase
VIAVGVVVWAVSARQAFFRLSWSDEIVYAVMGRNIAAGRGPISSFYDARSIQVKGYPLGDVHMPGHPFLLSLAFAALGTHEYAAVVPSVVAYLASGLLLFLAGRTVFDSDVGLLAATILYLFPSLAGYAGSAMAETPLVCLSCVYLLLWVRAVDEPSRRRLVGLAVLLGLGATVRETFFALLLPTLYVLYRVPRGTRLRAGLTFGATLLGYVLLVFWPLYRARAPYPNYLADLLASPTVGGVAAALARNAAGNLVGLATAWREPEEAAARLVLLLGLLLPLFGLGRPGAQRTLAGYAATATVAALLPVLLAYSLEGWTGLRVVLFTLPAGILLLAALLRGLRPGLLRRGATLLTLAVLVLLSSAVDRALVLDRMAEYQDGDRRSLSLERSLRCAGPQALVVAERAFLYGWRAFPATVVWHGTLSPQELAILGSTLSIDRVGTTSGQAVALGCESLPRPRIDRARPRA